MPISASVNGHILSPLLALCSFVLSWNEIIVTGLKTTVLQDAFLMIVTEPTERRDERAKLENQSSANSPVNTLDMVKALGPLDVMGKN